jgi:hypothetical protein
MSIIKIIKNILFILHRERSFMREIFGFFIIIRLLYLEPSYLLVLSEVIVAIAFFLSNDTSESKKTIVDKLEKDIKDDIEDDNL